MASNDDMVPRISAAVCNALKFSATGTCQVADDVLFPEMFEMSCQGLMPSRRTNELDVCRTVFVRQIFS